MRRWAWVVLMLVACEPAAGPADGSALPQDSGPQPTVDGGAADAGGQDAGPTPRVDAGAPPVDAGAPPGRDGGTRLLVGSAPGQLISYGFDLATGLPDQADVVVQDFGAPLLSAALRPGSDLVYVATQASGDASATVRVLRLEPDGALTPLSQATVGAKNVSLTFDAKGSWLLMSNGSSFRAAPLLADGSVGAAKALGTCNAEGLATNPAATALYGVCGYDNTLVRYDFSAAAGPTLQRTQVTFSTSQRVHPVAVEPFAGKLLVQGLRENGVPSSNNRLALVGLEASAPESVLTLTPAAEGPMSVPYATALATHPRLQVAYAANGDSYQYAGMSLSVIGLNSSGALESRQDLDAFFGTRALRVSPDGRWLMVGSHAVNEVRRWSIDPGTGKLSEDLVIAVVDDPVFLGFH